MDNPENIEKLRKELRQLEHRLKDLEQGVVEALNVFDPDASQLIGELRSVPVFTYLAEFHEGVFSKLDILTAQFMGLSDSKVQLTAGKFLDQYLHPEDRNSFRRTYYALKHSIKSDRSVRQHHSSLFRLRSTADIWIWVHSVSVLWRHTDDPDKSRIFGLGVDISDLIRRNDEAIRLALENRKLKARIFESLSKRERKMAHLLLEGKSAREIASSLHLSQVAVEAHLDKLLSKLEVKEVEGMLQYVMYDAG